MSPRKIAVILLFGFLILGILWNKNFLQRPSELSLPRPLTAEPTSSPGQNQGQDQDQKNSTPVTETTVALPSDTERFLSPPPQETQVSKEEFRQLILKAFATLPKQTDAEKFISEDVHQTPPQLIAQIQPLLDINRAARTNPALIPEALRFYKNCASDSVLMTAVRARCLSHLRKLSESQGKTVDLSKFSERVRKLSDFFPF